MLSLDRLFAAAPAKSDDRNEAILWIRKEMAKKGVSFEDLVAAGCFDDGHAQQAPRYRSADGQTWDGRGQMPDWLQRAVNAGQSVDHFKVG